MGRKSTGEGIFVKSNLECIWLERYTTCDISRCSSTHRCGTAQNHGLVSAWLSQRIRQGLWDKVPEEDRSRLRTLNFPLPSQCAEAVAQHISEPDSNISTHNNLEAAASNTGGGEDHCEFWAEVCNAQAGVSVDQGCSAPVEFGEECVSANR